MIYIYIIQTSYIWLVTQFICSRERKRGFKFWIECCMLSSIGFYASEPLFICFGNLIFMITTLLNKATQIKFQIQVYMLAHTCLYARNHVSTLTIRFLCSQSGLYARRYFKYFFEKNKNIQIWCQIVHKNISNLVVKTVCELDVRAKNYREKTECNINGWVLAGLRQVAGMCQVVLFCV